METVVYGSLMHIYWKKQLVMVKMILVLMVKSIIVAIIRIIMNNTIITLSYTVYTG